MENNQNKDTFSYTYSARQPSEIEKIRKREREKIAPEIIHLTDDLMKEYNICQI